MKTSIQVVVALLLVAIAGSAGIAQTPATGRVMREKLGHSQKILEAILTSNFAMLDRESAALAKATESPAWTVLKSPEYMKQSDAFLQALRELTAAAKERDLDAAAQRYNALTTTCFGCHRSMKDRRLAVRP
jgi:cytochrome c556